MVPPRKRVQVSMMGPCDTESACSPETDKHPGLMLPTSGWEVSLGKMLNSDTLGV